MSAMSGLHRLGVATVLSGLVLAGAAGTSADQQVGTILPPAGISTEEAAAVAQYWVMLASGRVAEVIGPVHQLLDRYPRSSAVLALAIEVDIAGTGATAALATYESWIGQRRHEEPVLLRRIARAVLYEWGRQVTLGSVRSEALLILADDGDANALAVIASIAASGQEAGLRAGVRMKRAAAIGQLAERIRATSGSKVRDIQILDEARSPLTAPVLIEVLSDPLPENRSAAAEALARSGGIGVIEALEPLLKDPHGVVRVSAAGALYQLGSVAGLGILEELAASENSTARRRAAQYLARNPDERWLALVRGLLVDPDPVIRLDAAKMIAPHDPASAQAVLAQLAADPSLGVREETEIVRAELPTSSFADLRILMRSATPVARIRAAGSILALTR